MTASIPIAADQGVMRLNTATVVGDTAELMARAESLINRAVEREGIKALACSRRAAAHHEAGHAVVHALDGHAVEYVKVKRKQHPRTGLVLWLGFTQVRQPWSATFDTTPEDDLANLAHVAAGFCAEVLFEGPDFALCSSLDEMLMVGNIAAMIAHKTDREPAQVFQAAVLSVLADLHQHAAHVRAIADLLQRDRIVRAARLVKLLPPPLGIPRQQRSYSKPLLEGLTETMMALKVRFDGIAA